MSAHDPFGTTWPLDVLLLTCNDPFATPLMRPQAWVDLCFPLAVYIPCLPTLQPTRGTRSTFTIAVTCTEPCKVTNCWSYYLTFPLTPLTAKKKTRAGGGKQEHLNTFSHRYLDGLEALCLPARLLSSQQAVSVSVLLIRQLY